MMTASDWFAEMRSNRYHFATRFARHLPVIFVQPDLNEPQFRYEESGTEGITVLHVCQHFEWKQCVLLRTALRRKGIVKPLLWVYNYEFVDFIAARHAPFTVYHATEDYFSPEIGLSVSRQNKLKEVLKLTDLLVAVSEGVLQSYMGRGNYQGNALAIENGCDFKFWAPRPEELGGILSRASMTPVAFYQGGIHRKIDFELLHCIVRAMPDWEFWFCGEVYPNLPEWDALCQYKNVTYHGKLRPEEVRTLALRATVGLIPFVQNEWIIQRSFPLKAFEYIACGLPVISVPIDALKPYSAIIRFPTTADQFIGAMKSTAPTRFNPECISQRMSIAQQHDYDLKFDSLLSADTFRSGSTRPLRQAVQSLYSRNKIIGKSFMKNLRKEASLYKQAVMSCGSRVHGSKSNL